MITEHTRGSQRLRILQELNRLLNLEEKSQFLDATGGVEGCPIQPTAGADGLFPDLG